MQWRRAQVLVLAVIGALLFASGDFSGRVQSDERGDSDRPSPVGVAPGKSALHRLLDESAAQYAVYADADAKEPSKLRCVLHWANQSRGSVDGAAHDRSCREEIG